MKKQLIIAFCLGIFACMCVAFSTPRELKEPTKDTKVFVSKDANQIDTIIEQWSKYGYEVKEIATQSVSTAVTADYYFYNSTSFRDIKGDIILVMVKYG